MDPRLDRRCFLSRCFAGGAALAASAAFPHLVSAGTNGLSKWKTGYAYDDRLSTYYASPETPDRIVWINDRVVNTGLAKDLTAITAHADPMTYIKQIHTDSHITMVQQWGSSTPGYAPAGPLAELAVGYVLGAVRDVCEGRVRNAFCCIRPPGHHAINSGYSGYCFYGNVRIAAAFAKQVYGIERILIVDWDIHHGNGTQGLLCDDASVLFFDVYQHEMFPNPCNDFASEGPTAVAVPDTLTDYRVNVIMPSGVTNEQYVALFQDKLVPLAEKFKPQLVLISSGFDLKKFDTHSTTAVTNAGLSKMTRIAMDIADTYAGGKLVAILEGGYADNTTGNTYYGLSSCAESVIRTLATGELQSEDPFFTDGVWTLSAPRELLRDHACVAGTRLRVPYGFSRVAIMDSRGSVVRVHQGTRTDNGIIDMREFNLVPGAYLVRVIAFTGRIEMLPIHVR
jgi:acetoin utilization deacetylase AcuC-like enzyme